MALAEFPRKGAWAKLADGTVGIINNIRHGVAEFHAVDAKGETVSVNGILDRQTNTIKDGIPTEFLTQATHTDIPKSRRPARAHGEALGYK